MATTTKTKTDPMAVLADAVARAKVKADFDMRAFMIESLPAASFTKAETDEKLKPYMVERGDAARLASARRVLILGGKALAQADEKGKEIFAEGGWTGNWQHLANAVADAMIDGAKLDAAVVAVRAKRVKAGVQAIAKAKGSSLARAMEELIADLGLDKKAATEFRANLNALRKHF